MAKQHVSPIERHLEKIVLGIAGLILLWALVSYLIFSPNQIEFGGEMLPPGELYTKIEEQAKTKLMSMQRVTPDNGNQSEDQPPPMPDPSRQISPIQSDPKLKPTFATAFVPPGIKVPDIQETLGGDVVLARILPLRKPLLTQGKAMADFPPVDPIQVGSTSGARSTERRGAIFPHEYQWVTLWTFLNRKAQRALFEKAGYEFGRQKIMVASVEVQRQQMQPDGTWSTPESISPYDPAPIQGIRPRVPVIDIGGTASINDQDRAHIESARKLLENREGQQQVLRPPFQEYLGDEEWRWQPPAELTGDKELVWQKYGVRLYDLSEGNLKHHGKPGQPTSPKSGTRYYIETLKNAKDLIDKQDFLEAYNVLKELAAVSDPDAERYTKQANDLLNQYSRDFETAIQKRRQEIEAQATAREIYYGDDLDPVWVNDRDVEPGKRYRYRVRPVLLNSYAGAPALVKNPDDGGKVLLEGDWSAWSADILVQPNTYLFFVGADEQLRTANVRLYRWADGKWDDTTATFGIGDRITAERRNVQYNYDGVVAGLEFDRPFSKRQDNAGTVSYQETRTAALTLVSDQGQVEERLAEQDGAERSRLDDQIDREQAVERILTNEGPQTLIVPPPEDAMIEGYQPDRGTFGRPGLGAPGNLGGPPERAPYRRPGRERLRPGRESRGRAAPPS